MKTRTFGNVIVGLWALACSASQPTPTQGIELDPEQGQSPSTLGQSTGAPPNDALIASGSTEPAGATDDSQFVFSRAPQGQPPPDVSRLPIHINEEWWPFRAQQLGLTEDEAKARDGRLSRTQAPRGFWDQQTALEAVSVWTVLCNECHGGRRHLEDALDMPPPPPTWGQGEGLFFGNRRTYQHVFKAVHDGGPQRAPGQPTMPAWKNILPTEMMWALLYFLEYQSGGIEGGFPPSLYPRRPKVLDQQQ